MASLTIYVLSTNGGIGSLPMHTLTDLHSLVDGYTEADWRGARLQAQFAANGYNERKVEQDISDPEEPWSDYAAFCAEVECELDRRNT